MFTIKHSEIKVSRPPRVKFNVATLMKYRSMIAGMMVVQGLQGAGTDNYGNWKLSIYYCTV